MGKPSLSTKPNQTTNKREVDLKEKTAKGEGQLQQKVVLLWASEKQISNKPEITHLLSGGNGPPNGCRRWSPKDQFLFLAVALLFMGDFGRKKGYRSSGGPGNLVPLTCGFKFLAASEVRNGFRIHPQYVHCSKTWKYHSSLWNAPLRPSKERIPASHFHVCFLKKRKQTQIHSKKRRPHTLDGWTAAVLLCKSTFGSVPIPTSWAPGYLGSKLGPDQIGFDAAALRPFKAVPEGDHSLEKHPYRASYNPMKQSPWPIGCGALRKQG